MDMWRPRKGRVGRGPEARSPQPCAFTPAQPLFQPLPGGAAAGPPRLSLGPVPRGAFPTPHRPWTLAQGGPLDLWAVSLGL